VESEQQWSEYLGRMQESQIVISADRIKGLAALLDYPEPPWPDNQVPPTGHWCFIFPYTQQSKLGHDGHEQLGGFFPPVKYPRRMWVGGRIRYMLPLRVGEPVTHRSTIKGIENKQGRSGPMTFLTVCHEYLDGGILMLQDEQDIVYRDVSTDPIKKPVDTSHQASASPHPYDWSRTIVPDTTLLFRYSAVSFNSHRIHYDQDYVRKEGYPGLLVHGPLTATLLIDLFQRSNPGIGIRQFDYVARSPMYEGYPFTIMGQQLENGKISLWAVDCEGTRSMTAELETDMERTGG
jgi:3-methylfumaryl-CoA hydratase